MDKPFVLTVTNDRPISRASVIAVVAEGRNYFLSPEFFFHLFQ
jgi:hypothetical protein